MPKEDTSIFTTFSGMFGSSRRTARAPPSGANPENLVGQTVNNEVDVLHIPDLPTFEGRLATRDSELLVSYLCAPYLRIPLVMRFFADKSRIQALGELQIQEIVDACLFEPGPWHKDKDRKLPETIPNATREHMHTPVGLLFNELQKSPANIIESLEELLAIVIELDVGRYDATSCPLILYVVRLMIRVEGYMLFLIRHKEWENSGEAATKAGGASWIRGLDISDDNYTMLKDTQARMREQLDDFVLPMIDGWLQRATKENQHEAMCILHAHLAYMCKNYDTEDFTQRTISIMLSSQIFLYLNYRYDIEVSPYDDVKDRTKADENVDESLLLPQTEIFDMFQRHRRKVLNWLNENEEARNEVMEAVVRVCTRMGTRDEAANIPEDLAAIAAQEDRKWVNLNRPGCNGRFVPIGDKNDTKVNTNSFEEWMRLTTTQAVETEINVQLGEFTLRRHTMGLLDEQITHFADFKEVFRKGVDGKMEAGAHIATAHGGGIQMQASEVRQRPPRVALVRSLL